jgi:UDP-N-acetylglucosamine--N-acetylmuramyl-(pentapeptide) pyrophosphoryl-undecaprenol N-acetylglucosamine transferase
MAKQAGIPFISIPAGKIRRYFSLKNLVTPLFVFTGFCKSFSILRKFRPDCIFGAGSFVQVPLIWAAWFLKIPTIIHQQDIVPSLANNLCQIMAKKITVSFEKSVKDFTSGSGIFYKRKNVQKAIFTGNPIRKSLKLVEKKKALKFFGLDDEYPTLLVLGGGTGSQFINNLIYQSLPQLSEIVQIIHATGKGKAKPITLPYYRSFEFIDHMDMAYSAADFVLCRAGMSTISELSYLEKVGIVIPLPKTHQEANALLLDFLRAALVIPQGKLTPQILISMIRKLIFKFDIQKLIKHNIAKIMPHNAARKIAEEITKLASRDYEQGK